MKTNQQKQVKPVVSLEQAIKETREFIYFHDELKFGKLKEDDAVCTEYAYIISALQRGLLIIDEKKNPVYTLLDPIESGDNSVTQINFRTRIKPMDSSNITAGLDISKNQFEYILRCNCFLTGLPKGIMNNLSKYDLKVVEQICTLFL